MNPTSKSLCIDALNNLWKVFGALVAVIAIVGISEPCYAQIGDASHIDALITPYYNPNGPIVNVGQYSSGLASTDEKTFLATIREMKRSWYKLSFPELYTGAICLYNRGYRWESVYWFYTAQYRGALFKRLADSTKMGGIGNKAFDLYAVNGAFRKTLGQYINAFACGDMKRLTDTIQRVIDGTTIIPDMQKIYPNVAFVDSTKWQAINSNVADQLKQLINMFFSKADEIAKQRASNGTDTKFGSLKNKEIPAD